MPRRSKPAIVPPPRRDAIALHFTPDELGMVCAALDSHIYWELSDRQYRNSGYVDEPGSNDDETAAEIRAAELLMIRLDALRPKDQD
jgi:hypothetical protein